MKTLTVNIIVFLAGFLRFFKKLTKLFFNMLSLQQQKKIHQQENQGFVTKALQF
jgi:hypothetical protein